MHKRDFANKVVFITGSSTGIGLETARELAGRGAKVVLNARGVERLETAEKQLASEGYDVLALTGDITSPEKCSEMVDKTVNHFGKLDILINNAGISMRSEMEELNPETCKKVVDINLLGSIYPTFYAIPELKKTAGSIVFISSIAGIIGLPTATLYCATKRALVALAESLRCELATHNVHIGVVYVGFTENDPQKEVIGPKEQMVPHNRPNHMSRKKVAENIAQMIKKRKKQVVLTPVGKIVRFISRFSPGLVENVIITGKKYDLGNKLGIR